ncbi:MAG: glycosyltransferase family 39 protein [Lachnospiraceae bacterium]|nr:glycosyltransferase family 39 protein [Lachnospiraceae bacterium]
MVTYAAVSICGCVFVLLSASWVSPLFKDSYGYDSSWYSMMGRAITQGMVPYRDYFDLKGPVFFFIEAIGQLFRHGRVGIFIIECIAASISCIFIWKTCRLYVKPWQALIVMLLTGFVAVSPFWGGNTCEEYMLPFNYACIYLTLKYLKDERYEEYFLPSLIFGISFSVMVLSKVPTCAPMAAAAVTVLIVLIMKKQTRHLPGIIGYFMLGFLMIFIPVCVYFLLHGAFKDFIYAAFIFAYKRGTDYYETFSWDWESKLIICYCSFIASLIIPTRKSGEHYLRIFGIAISLVTWAFLHLGTPYDYYFLLTMPCFIYMVMSLFAHWNNRAESLYKNVSEKADSTGEESRPANSEADMANTLLHSSSQTGEFADDVLQSENQAENVSDTIVKPRRKFRPDKKRIVIQRRVLWIILILIVLNHYYPDTMFKYRENRNLYERESDPYVEECKEVLTIIPEEEWDSIYNLESGMIFYEVNQLLPANRYPVNLPYFMHLNPEIKANVLKYLDIVKPRYIISENMANFDDSDTRDYVFNHYELYRDVGAEEIYIRIK